MVKRAISLLLMLCMVISVIVPQTIALESSWAKRASMTVLNSDVEAYENGWYYYVETSQTRYVYRETVDFKDRHYYTDYAVDEIIVCNEMLYMSIGTAIFALNIVTGDQVELIACENAIVRFALCDSSLYFLHGNQIDAYNLDTGETKTVLAKPGIEHFWLDDSRTIAYMMGDDSTYYYDCYTHETTKTASNETSLETVPRRNKGLTLSALRLKFPNGEYWNHMPNRGTGKAYNNQDGTTTLPCYEHNGYCGTSMQTCNGFAPGGSREMSWQCMGYAEKCGYDTTGYNPRNNANGWYTYENTSALNDLKAGDIVQYKNGGHAIFVTAVSGDMVTYTDCNSDNRCIIRWDATISKSTLKSTFSRVRSAPADISSIPIEITPGVYTIHSARDWNKVLNIAGNSKENGANIQLYDYLNKAVQKFRIVREGEYYCIQSVYSGMWLDVAAPASESKSNVQLWHTNENYEQKWSFEDAGNGYVYIKNYYGNYVDLAGDSTQNGTNIQVYHVKESDSQRWKLVPAAEPISVPEGVYTIHSARDENKVLDIEGNSDENRANIQLYDYLDNEVQKFRVIKEGSYYLIQSVYSGYYLDVRVPVTQSRSNVQLYEKNENPEERWIFEDGGDGFVYIRNYYGNYVDLAGDSTQNGTNIQVYHVKESDSQRWRLHPIRYQILIDGNGGTADTDGFQVKFGGYCTLSPSLVSRAGYTLDGWNLYRPADKKWYTDAGWFTAEEIAAKGYSKQKCAKDLSMELDTSWLDDADASVVDTFTFYAVWKKNAAVKVAFEPMGGDVSQTSISVTPGLPYGALPNATRANYTFKGWYTSASGGEQVSASTVVTATTDHTLYAHWEHICAGGHIYVYKATKIPTTSETGTLTGNCSRCFGTTTVTMPQLNTTDYTYEVIKAASCTTTGIGRYTWNDKNYGSFSFDVTIQQTPHDYRNAITDPTCTEQGYTTYRCSVCGDSYVSDIVAATGHSFADGKCSVCGADDPACLPENPFIDVEEADYFFIPVLWALQKEITNGISATEFGPNAHCTRGQIVTFLWRACGSPEPTMTANPFSDVKEAEYYYKAVLWAVENSITTGMSETTFEPDATCTRGQVATFLWRTQGKPDSQSSTNPFVDVRSGEYYYDAVLWAVGNGVTQGTGINTFSPDDSCTRGQIVTFLYRVLAK